jgi:predicted ATPase
LLQFHYDLGVLLHSKSRGQDVTDDVIQKIVDQINCGLSKVDPTMKMEIAELNVNVGTAAMDRADFDAANLYFKNATTLLENVDLWAINYELSLRFYSLKAKSAYCSGSVNEAITYLLEILERARCITDKHDAYYHYALYLLDCDEKAKSLATCIKVLSYLGESIPESIDKKTIATMMKQTGAKLAKKDILSIKDADTNNLLCFTLKMYVLLVRAFDLTRAIQYCHIFCSHSSLFHHFVSL